MRCPGERVLGMAFSEGAGAELTGHLGGCAACAGRWKELAQLRALARELPQPELDDGSREAMRAALLAGPAEAYPQRRRWPFAVAAVTAAAAAAAVWFFVTRAPPAPASHAAVRALPGTLYAREGTAADEIMRLHDGALTLEVRPLGRGERFRVMTDDAEVEVRGTAFQVIADGDRLAAVWVAHGVVEVRPHGLPAATLRAGDAWTPARVAAIAQPPAAPPPIPPPAPPAAAVRARPHLPSRPITPPPPITPAEMAAAPAPPAPVSSGASATERAFDEGFDALRGGDAARAAAAFERAAASGGSLSEDASFWYAVALQRAGRPARALGAFAAFLASYPASPRAGEAAVAAGWLALDAGRPDDAAAYFVRGTHDPDPAVRAAAEDGLRAKEERGAGTKSQ